MIDIKSIVSGEFAENTVRKEPTPSERVAIAEAVKAKLGERQGGDRRSDEFQNPQKRTLSEGKTEDIAAKAAGFGSADTLIRAKTVVAKGAPELVEAMDKNELSINAAAQLTKLPTEEQRGALKGGTHAIVAEAKRLREKERQKTLEAESAPAPKSTIIQLPVVTKTVRVAVPYQKAEKSRSSW